MQRQTRIAAIVIAVSVGMLLGCSGGSTSTTNSNSSSSKPSVTVSPAIANVDQSGTQQFTASVTGAADTSVTWSVQEPNGGVIDASGSYHAPKTPGKFHVIATSVANPQMTATAAILVPFVAVEVTPANTTIGPGTTQTFTANVLGSVDHVVNWSIQEGAAGGTISSAGLYNAPPVLGTYHIIATSDADATKNAVATTTIASISVSVIPPKDTLGPSGERRFTAVLTASSAAGVVWSLFEGAGAGLLDQFGLYTAGQQQGTYHVIASSVADTNQTATASVDVVASGFRPTGNMNTPRSAARATLLTDGRVLVTGGQIVSPDFCGPSPTNVATGAAELYDPAAGTFAITGAMANGRLWHAATLLADGRVLVTGGSDGTNSLPSAEIFDPASGAFTATGVMGTARFGHTATRLQNGKVLITGGWNRNSVASAEIYDPSTGTFTPTGNMSVPRGFHTATLLPDCSVLITGGENLQSAEVYDPSTGFFTTTGSMTETRSNHTATLFADGLHVLVTGGVNSTGASATAEIYNIATRTFAMTGTMRFARSDHSGSLLSSGLVLVSGGDGPNTLTTAELYDPATGMFTQTGGLLAARTAHAAVVLKDGATVLVTGGAFTDSGQLMPIGTAEIFR